MLIRTTASRMHIVGRKGFSLSRPATKLQVGTARDHSTTGKSANSNDQRCSWRQQPTTPRVVTHSIERHAHRAKPTCEEPIKMPLGSKIQLPITAYQGTRVGESIPCCSTKCWIHDVGSYTHDKANTIARRPRKKNICLYDIRVEPGVRTTSSPGPMVLFIIKWTRGGVDRPCDLKDRKTTEAETKK